MNPAMALFCAGLVVYGVMAALGWYKLPFGFNFIDEGMYMADSWRLVAGDRLFPDSYLSVVRLYVLFNAVLFKLWPDITLLDFRQIQFVLSLLTTLGLGWAVFRWTREYWYLPWMLAVFAFTGLDPVGKGTNLSYHNYVHLFVTWHVILLLFALRCDHGWRRRALLIGSGVALWAVGVSVLPLSVFAVSPVVVWLVVRGLAKDRDLFGVADLLWVLAPVAVGWAGLIGFYHPHLLDAVRTVAGYFREGGKTENGINWLALAFVAVSALFCLMIVVLARWPKRWAIGGVAALSAGLLAVLETNLFGRIPGYWRGWFDGPMWFSSLLIVGMAGCVLWVGWSIRAGKKWSSTQMVVPLLLVPAICLSANFGYVSEMGMMAPNYASFIALCGTALLVLRLLESVKTVLVRAAVLLLLTGPFCYLVAWADWRFTYFDLPPHQLTEVVETGFAKGIRTNPFYHLMIRWMADRSARLSGPEDRVIAMDRAPMVHMITRRKPALNHSWLGMARSASLRQDAVTQMLASGREPKLAFVFLVPPLFYPISLKDGTAGIGGPIPYLRTDPIYRHITQTMKPVDLFRYKGIEWVALYRRP